MYATHQTMWHPLHPQCTNHLTLMSKKKNPPRLSFPYEFPTEFHPLFIPDPPQLTYPLPPPVQGSPIGKTCPEDVPWRLVPHRSDLLCHPEQAGGWLTDPATSGRWGELDSKRSLLSGTDFNPSLCLSPNPFTNIVNPKYVPWYELS